MNAAKLCRNVFSTWFGYAASLIAAFLLAPFIVHHLGNTGYGIWILITSLTGYCGMLDLGLRQSVGRYVSQYMALDDHNNVNRTLVNALAMLIAGGILALLIASAIVLNFDHFHIDRRLVAAGKAALLITAVNVAVALPMSIFNTILFSLERFDLLTVASLASTVVKTVLVLVVISHGGGVVALAIITLIASCCESITNASAAIVLYGHLALRLNLLAGARCRELLGFGVFRFLWIVANQLIFYSDSVVVGLFLNAAAITFYAIAGSLINYGRNIVSLLADTLLPSATRLFATDDMNSLRRLQMVGTQMCLSVGLPICIGYIFLGKEFISLWMGAGYSISALILSVLTISQLTSMPQYISAVILVSTAKHRVLAYIAIAEGLANLALSIYLVKTIGIVGVAVGTVVPQLITTSWLLPAYTLSAIGLRFRDYVQQAVLRPFIAAVPVAVFAYALRESHIPSSWLLFACKAILIVVAFALSSYVICLSETQRRSVRNNVFSFGRRIVYTTN